ncbi:MAG: helix-turn-helix transcriptional regulator [Ruminococcus sp.]|nr:helix-turn-helix transcriptional regulator [Ruminococcus sp.]
MSYPDKLWKAFTANAVTNSSDMAVCIPVGIEGTKSRNYVCRLWDGVYLWGNEIYEHFIPESLCRIWHLNIAAVNLCIDGRCETALENDTFVYMSPGLLNINTNAPKEGYSYPGNHYVGLEIAFDLDVLKQSEPACLKDLGLGLDFLAGTIKKGRGSLMAEVGESAMAQAEHMYNSLKSDCLSLEEHRFETVSLLYALTHGGAEEVKGIQYATKGQRHIANEVERRITSDLSKKITVEELAGDYGISPSALKKYFDMIYGMPISHYLKVKRMDRAKQLLSETRLTVKDIASICGYENQGKFGTAFKAYIGMLPLEYRRQNYTGGV